MIIEENYLSDRGRGRRRSVRVDLDEVRRGLDVPSAKDLSVWQQIRDQLQRRAGEVMFAIWLEPVELIAIEVDRRLVLGAPAPTAAWTSARFGRLLAGTAFEVGRELRFANEAERHGFEACMPGTPIPDSRKEAAG